MRLFLSSQGLGSQPEKLAELINLPHPKAAIISNAGDMYPPESTADRVGQAVKELAAIGIIGQALDLKKYFDKPAELERALSGYDAVYVRGGNAFILLRAIRASGFDDIVKRRLQDNTLVYAGYSAGSCVVTPDLHGIELMDPPDQLPPGYKPEVVWQGMGLVDFVVVPHYQSDHHESAAAAEVVEYYEKHGISYRALHDGEVIIVNGDRTES